MVAATSPSSGWRPATPQTCCSDREDDRDDAASEVGRMSASRTATIALQSEQVQHIRRWTHVTCSNTPDATIAVDPHSEHTI